MWQIFLIGYLTLGVCGYLLRRSLAQSLAQHNKLVNSFFFLLQFSIGLIIAAFLHPSFYIGWQNVAFLITGSLIFPIAQILGYKANNDIDAGLYTILNNLKPLITISTAWLLLHESLIGHQIPGAVIIIVSSFLVTLPNLKHHIKNKNSGLLLALASIALVGVGTTYDRFMLTRIDFAAYLVYAWGIQALWMLILAWPDRKHLRLLWKKQNIAPVTFFGLSTALKGLSFLAALKLSGNAALVSASGSFMAILVVIAAFITLKERKWIWLKAGAALAGALGLIILGSP